MLNKREPKQYRPITPFFLFMGLIYRLPAALTTGPLNRSQIQHKQNKNANTIYRSRKKLVNTNF